MHRDESERKSTEATSEMTTRAPKSHRDSDQKVEREPVQTADEKKIKWQRLVFGEYYALVRSQTRYLRTLQVRAKVR